MVRSPIKNADQAKPMVIAPLPRPQSRRVQFGLGTMFLLVSLGGPVLAALLMVPPEFYMLVFSLIGLAWIFILVSLAMSFLKPSWAASLLGLSLTVFVLVHVALFSNRLRFPSPVISTLMIATWIQASSAAAGFFISMARHSH